MTRQEFLNDVTSWWELIDFCNDYGCDCCDDIYDERARDEAIDERLVDMARECGGWTELYDILDKIPNGYDYYRYDDYGDWYGLDDYDFDDYKDNVLEWGDNGGVWDDDDDEEEPLPDNNEENEEDQFDDDDDFVAAEEPISIGELMGVCNSQLKRIGDDKKAEAEEEDEAFEVFVAGCVTIVEGE